MERYSRYRLKHGQLTGGGPRASGATVFVAYRFTNPVSTRFRESLEVRVRNSEALCAVDLMDGHVEKGEHWLQKIRERIQSCRLVIADVTGLSPEVLFEVGLAWGMNRPIVPAVEESSGLAKLPNWLTELQIGSFATEYEWAELLDSISARISLKSSSTQRKPRPKPIPGKALWLRGPGPFEQLREHMIHTATRYQLTMPAEDMPPSLGDAGESLVNEASRASLVVGSVSSSPSDTFIHFVAGLVVSKPTAGAATEKLMRRIIIAVPNGLKIEDVVSDSASRCHATVRVVRLRDLAQEIVNWANVYKRYNERISPPHK